MTQKRRSEGKGGTIRRWREQHGLSQRAAAALVGTTQGTWWRIENGRVRPSRAIAKKLLALGIAPEVLLGIAA